MGPLWSVNWLTLWRCLSRCSVVPGQGVKGEPGWNLYSDPQAMTYFCIIPHQIEGGGLYTHMQQEA